MISCDIVGKVFIRRMRPDRKNACIVENVGKLVNMCIKKRIEAYWEIQYAFYNVFIQII